MKLCLITDKTDFALEAERSGVERIMLDLEREGKAQRQAGRELFLSDHVVESVAKMRAVLRESRLVVRINPLNRKSAVEVDEVVEGGADFIMLPYFHTPDEVRTFLALVRKRARVILLVETRLAVEALPRIVKERGVDEIHIGLNDLSISLGSRNIFEPICDGLIDGLAGLLKEEGIPFGFGGIARLSRRGLPVNPERVLAEQVRLDTSVGWLGRSFRGGMESERRPGELAHELNLIREAVGKWRSATGEDFARNREALKREVEVWECGLHHLG